MSALLRVSNLHVSASGVEILHAIDLSLEAGEFVAIVGPNGSGKTKLLHALLGATPGEGAINWFDQPLQKWSRRELAKRVAFMSQTPSHEIGDRVIDVIKLGRLPFQGILALETVEDENAIAKVIDDLELRALIHRPMETLSGGQRQRVFLGRTLVQTPRVLLLDEPTTFLDLRHQLDLYRLIERVVADRGIAVMMASHDLNLAARHAQRAIVLKNGRILAQGIIEIAMTGPILSEAFDVPIQAQHVDGRPHFILKESSSAS